MNKQIIINATSNQTRIAFLDNNKLVDLFIELPEDKKLVGNIYLGKVGKIFPGINAAFVNIGMKNDAFLHFSDIARQTEELSKIADDYDDIDDFDEIEEYDNVPSKNQLSGLKLKANNSGIHLTKNQEIIVQIIKEPIGNKGVRITTGISIPGRFCVLLPFNRRIGVSKKITDREERRRLRSIARKILPRDCGLIIRTNSEHQTEEALQDDLKLLLKTWDSIQRKAKSSEPPALLYKDLDTTISTIRDLFNDEINKIIVDDKKVYNEIIDYLNLVQPEKANKVELYKENTPIFERYGVEQQVKKYLGRKVPLQSGGYLIIEHTEAMTVIDVNSGTYVQHKDQEENSLKINLQAANEIARQLRLRDIGGLIVIDFIDVREEKNKQLIFEEMLKAFENDRAKVHILPMTEFALIQMTRQRIRSNYLQMTSEICECCGGTGIVTEKTSYLYELEKEINTIKNETKYRSLLIKIHPYYYEKLTNGGIFSPIFKLQIKYLMYIKLEIDEKLRPGNFKIFSLKDNKVLLK
jgi:ribonuclease G